MICVKINVGAASSIIYCERPPQFFPYLSEAYHMKRKAAPNMSTTDIKANIQKAYDNIALRYKDWTESTHHTRMRYLDELLSRLQDQSLPRNKIERQEFKIFESHKAFISWNSVAELEFPSRRSSPHKLPRISSSQQMTSQPPSSNWLNRSFRNLTMWIFCNTI